MIKVINIITDKNIGGAGIVLQNYFAHADYDKYQHTVILPQNAELLDRLMELGIRITELPELKAKSFDIDAISALKEKFKKLEPDIVHTHASLSARIAARQYRKCAIVHTRHSVFPQRKIKTTFPLKQILGRINNYYSDTIIAVSPAAGENLIETGTNPQKIVTVYNGVEPVRKLSDDEKAELRHSLGIEKDDYVCSIIARLVPEKGHIYVLEAAKLLKDLPLKIIIAGSGSADEQLRTFAKQHELNNCIFTGFIDDIAGVENISDFQLNASYGTEATSLSLLECMSLSAPVIASDFGGNPYIVKDGENGFLVPQHSGAALADAIRKLVENPEKIRQMGETAFKMYQDNFTANVMAKNIEKVYDNTWRVFNGN